MASQKELYLHDELPDLEVPFAPFHSRRSVVYGASPASTGCARGVG